MANLYRNQQITTSSPAELTLLLYNGAIRFISESIVSMEQGKIEKSHNANIRAQDIVSELMITLDIKYEISKTWLPLYEYILYCLFQGNIRKDKEQLLQAKYLLSELQEAWMVAMKIICPQQEINNAVDSVAKQLWLDYFFLTKKMVKCLEKQDLNLFYELMNQRKRSKEMIDITTDDEFINSDEGQKLLFEIRSDSQFIDHALHRQLNIKNKQYQVSVAYDSDMRTPVSRMSWEK